MSAVCPTAVLPAPLVFEESDRYQMAVFEFPDVLAERVPVQSTVLVMMLPLPFPMRTQFTSISLHATSNLYAPVDVPIPTFPRFS